ncbi:MAG: dephospho-CoA kinase [Cyclobacteriaceae bacterium]
MNSPIKVGVTGGIGSGKSTICRIFSCLGVPVYDADKSAKWLMHEQQDLVKQIIQLFGDASYQNGQLNRDYIASEVFQDGEKLGQLNSLVHPAVAKHFEGWVKQNSKAPYIIKEAALLYESGAYKDLDNMIIVVAPRHLRTDRVIERDPHRSIDELTSIMDKQWSDTRKISMGGKILINDDSKLMMPQILEMHDQFSRRLI